MSDQETPATASHADDDLKTVKRRNQNRIAQMLHRKRKDQKIEEVSTNDFRPSVMNTLPMTSLVNLSGIVAKTYRGDAT